MDAVRNRIAPKLIVSLDKYAPLLGRYIVVDQETGQMIQSGYNTRKQAQEDFPEAVNANEGIS